MNILVTGAFGSLGIYVIKALEANKHKIRCFDIATKRNLKIAKKYNDKFEVIWGDIRNLEDIQRIVKDQDIIIHLAFFLPPINDKNRSLAEAVNIRGTKNLISEAEKQTNPPKFIFASSVAIYGDTSNKLQPISVDEELNPTDEYSAHKVECMNLLKLSKLQYSIFILGVIIAVQKLTFDSKMFDMPPETNIEVIHPIDIGNAFANSVMNDMIWGKILHIAGGPSCRLKYYDFLSASMEVMGIGPLPEEAFGGTNYFTSFLSSEESNLLLDYQKHSYQDILLDMRKNNKLKISLAKLFKPLVRRYLLRQSPYYNQNFRTIEEKE